MRTTVMIAHTKTDSTTQTEPSAPFFLLQTLSTRVRDVSGSEVWLRARRLIMKVTHTYVYKAKINNIPRS